MISDTTFAAKAPPHQLYERLDLASTVTRHSDFFHTALPSKVCNEIRSPPCRPRLLLGAIAGGLFFLGL